MGSSSFWYIFATNGTDGFLLDLIRRPDRSMCRLALFSEGGPAVLQDTLPRQALERGGGNLSVRLGSFELTPHGVRGELEGTRIEAEFELTGRQASFAPAWLPKFSSRVPSLRSRYGQLRNGTCNGVQYQNLPLVYSTYDVGDLARARWYLVSASQFSGSDLRLEICASRWLGRWQTSAYVLFQGCEHRFASVYSSLFQARTLEAGNLVGGHRAFSVCLKSGMISLTVQGQAPLGSFAMLARDEFTEIHTTLFGTCTATVTLPGQSSPSTLVAERTCFA